jgi:hypothetical protein
MMPTHKETQEAFEIAMKNVGLKNFKRTSLFMRNVRQAVAEPESKAA